MLTVYLVALAFGGTLLGASLVLGGKDVGHDGDPSADAAQDGDGHDAGAATPGGHGHADPSWLPLASLRFWTFLLAFGGAVGTALTLLGSPASPVVVALAALGVGTASGIGSVAAVRALAAGSTDSATRPRELVGATGRLLLGAGPDEPGKVRVAIKDRVEDYVAVCDEPLATGARVLVVATEPDGRLVVTRDEPDLDRDRER